MRSGSGGGGLFLIRECRWRIWSEECFVECWVNTPVDREYECVCRGSFLCDNCEGAHSLVVKLLLWLREI